eukprot:356121-Chlamydomonas_euryale.AAC.9
MPQPRLRAWRRRPLALTGGLPARYPKHPCIYAPWLPTAMFTPRRGSWNEPAGHAPAPKGSLCGPESVQVARSKGFSLRPRECPGCTLQRGQFAAQRASRLHSSALVCAAVVKRG